MCMQEQEEYLIRAIQQIGMVEFLPITTNVLQIFERKLSAAILSKSWSMLSGSIGPTQKKKFHQKLETISI